MVLQGRCDKTTRLSTSQPLPTCLRTVSVPFPATKVMPMPSPHLCCFYRRGFFWSWVASSAASSVADLTVGRGGAGGQDSAIFESSRLGDVIPPSQPSIGDLWCHDHMTLPYLQVSVCPSYCSLCLWRWPPNPWKCCWGIVPILETNDLFAQPRGGS